MIRITEIHLEKPRHMGRWMNTNTIYLNVLSTGGDSNFHFPDHLVNLGNREVKEALVFRVILYLYSSVLWKWVVCPFDWLAGCLCEIEFLTETNKRGGVRVT